MREHRAVRVVSLCRMFRFNAGQGGVEVYPGCYSGLHANCGWQILGGAADVEPLSPGDVPVLPTVTAAFNPKAVYIFGISPESPGTNLRFTVGAITTGGRPQYANNKARPDGGAGEILSDAFNRSDEPIIVNNWSVLTTAGLGAPIVFSVFNLNPVPLRVYVTIWGNAMMSNFISAWKRAEDADNTITLVNDGPNDAEPFWRVVQTHRTPEESEAEYEGKKPTITVPDSMKKKRRKKKRKKVLGIF